MTELFKMPEEYLKHIPEKSVRKLEQWINEAGDLSGFWTQLLSGDYGSAACNADPENLRAFGWLLRFLEQSAPGHCFGSPENVRNWKGTVNTHDSD